MQILDKYGYLESALDYIEKNIVSGKGLQKIAIKTRINEDSLENLSLALRGLSEKQIITALQEELEDRHTSLSGATAEVSGADISIERENKRVFTLLSIVFDIVVDGEREDRTSADVKIFSKNKVRINF